MDRSIKIDLDEVKDYINKGLTVNDVARKIGVSDATLRKKLPLLEPSFMLQLKMNSSAKRKKMKWSEHGSHD